MWATKRAASPTVMIDGSSSDIRQPKKRLVIKRFTALPALPATYKADTLARLKNAVRAIHSSQPTTQGLEELYRDCEGLCLHKFGEDIYAMLQRELQQHVHANLTKINHAEDSSVLKQTHVFWTEYTQQLAMVKCVFLYLDRTYVLQTPNLLSIWSMGLRVVREHLAGSTDMAGKVVRLIVDQISADRDGKLIDHSMLAGLVNMLGELDLYAQPFMPCLIESTRAYYQREGKRLVGSLSKTLQSHLNTPAAAAAAASSNMAMDVPQYLNHVNRRLDEETQRSAGYLHKESKTRLLNATLDELVEKHTSRILTLGFDAMVGAHLVDDLARLYTLLLSVDRLSPLKKHWSTYIKKTGLRLMHVPDLNASLVPEVLSLKQNVDEILKSAFQRNSGLVKAMKDAFENFINIRRNKPAQLLARFVDQCMKPSGKATGEEDLDGLLDRVVVIFRFVNGKDAFEAYYKRDLAKRLLYGKSASVDAERAMLQKLRAECGPDYTKSLEGMLRDMDASGDLSEKFLYSEEYGKEIQLDADESAAFHASTLTQAFWPTYEPMALVVPKQAEQYQDQYVEFYSKKHAGRNLRWQPNLGTCVLKVQFEQGCKELVLSLVQGTIMMLFAENDGLTYTQVQENTGLEAAELQRTLQSLSCGKYRVLIKEPRSRDVNESDVFTFNSSFKSPQMRIRIGQIAIKEEEKEEKEVEEQVNTDRLFRIDAAIVRIMKVRKQAEHTALTTELLEQAKFSISAVEIKERVETLIERDYLKRDEESTSTYHYVA